MKLSINHHLILSVARLIESFYNINLMKLIIGLLFNIFLIFNYGECFSCYQDDRHGLPQKMTCINATICAKQITEKRINKFCALECQEGSHVFCCGTDYCNKSSNVTSIVIYQFLLIFCIYLCSFPF
ncbi:hypothetical protein SNEBB_007681 [Seison nebaliae]|nr:hypothetical protein SNEBB_007681 [Seison nebaliae]